MKEKKGFSMNAWLIVFFILALIIFSVVNVVNLLNGPNEATIFTFFLSTFLITVFCISGLYTLEPNENMVLMFFGKYVGTDKSVGFRWTNPLYKKRKMSLRIQDFETELIKVNDLNGNPIELSAIVIWRIQDTYAAYFEVEDYSKFITKQSISALRSLAMKYPYEAFSEDTESLITHTEEVADNLKIQIQERVSMAGLEILEARINHLSYAREIASAMLQRQQASAIISAKTEIVEGAVGMVQMALNNLESENIATFNPADKTRLVSNLLVVLCSDQGTQPIINTDG